MKEEIKRKRPVRTQNNKEANCYEEKVFYYWCGSCGAFGIWLIHKQQQWRSTGNGECNGTGGTEWRKWTNVPGGGTADLAPAETDGKDKETEQPETEKQTGETVEHRTGDNIVGISDKDITEIHTSKYDTVRNDVTEKWKCLVLAENNFDVTEYALSCYENHFDSDNTILAVINLTTKTSASISNVAGNLYVSEYEYVDGEEHDAKIMFSGMHLADYIVYIDNEKKKKVTEED